MAGGLVRGRVGVAVWWCVGGCGETGVRGLRIRPGMMDIGRTDSGGGRGGVASRRVAVRLPPPWPAAPASPLSRSATHTKMIRFPMNSYSFVTMMIRFPMVFDMVFDGDDQIPYEFM